MSTAARTKGIQATIIDGGCRDLLEHRELNYPVSQISVCR
jgi:regulator of RNase E activity RraA